MEKNLEIIEKVQKEINKTVQLLTVLKIAYDNARTNYEKMVLLKASTELVKKQKLLNEKLMDYIRL